MESKSPFVLQIITVSTREQRKGPVVTEWFEEIARTHGKFAIESIDLATVDLPLMNEPEHPRLRRYTHPHTKAWSATIERADAFVLITPEYNFSTPPSLVNAIDYLVNEWAYKAVGFVSYGGISGGLRGAQMTKLLLTSLKMMPLPEAVTLPFFAKSIDATTGKLAPPDTQIKAAHAMLDELHKWTGALITMRQPS
jgi:NAD(P)H-dependent FMN reductase